MSRESPCTGVIPGLGWCGLRRGALVASSMLVALLAVASGSSAERKGACCLDTSSSRVLAGRSVTRPCSSRRQTVRDSVGSASLGWRVVRGRAATAPGSCLLPVVREVGSVQQPRTSTGRTASFCRCRREHSVLLQGLFPRTAERSPARVSTTRIRLRRGST